MRIQYLIILLLLPFLFSFATCSEYMNISDLYTRTKAAPLNSASAIMIRGSLQVLESQSPELVDLCIADISASANNLKALATKPDLTYQDVITELAHLREKTAVYTTDMVIEEDMKVSFAIKVFTEVVKQYLKPETSRVALSVYTMSIAQGFERGVFLFREIE